MSNVSETAAVRNLTLLRVFLATEGYCQHAIEAVLAYAAAEGTIEGCPELDPEDYETAEGWLETGYPAVPMTSHAWGSATGNESPRNPLDDRWNTLGDVWYSDAAEFAHQYSMGSGPDEEPYNPSPEDLAELAEWAAGGMAFPRAMTQSERHEVALESMRDFRAW